MGIIEGLNSFFTGPVMVGAILVAGVTLSIKTGFVQIKRLGYTFLFAARSLKSKGGENTISPFEAVSTALSGTLGTGNIAGVATAIIIGGPGALFWMWVSAFFGMATKYCEIVLAMKYRKKTEGGYVGGAMYYIKEATGSGFLAAAFAVFCLLASFGMGNMTQANTAAVSLASVFSLDGGQIRIIFLFLSVLMCIIIFGGIKRISRIAAFITPFTAAVYIICCLFVILCQYKALPEVFSLIFKSAFCIKSAAGGVVGYGMIKAMRIGFARGVFTNEAGLGSAPIAHAAAENELPALQGLWGIFEVFLDTIFMCTLTGIVILISKVAPGNDMTIKAFSALLGKYAGGFIGVSTIIFALVTIIGWSYYGEVAVKYLFKSKLAVSCYKLIYSALIYFGAVSSMAFVWDISDIFNGLMMLPNILALLLLSKSVGEETVRLDGYIENEKKVKKQIRQKRRIKRTI